MDVRDSLRFDLMNVCIIGYVESAKLSELRDSDEFCRLGGIK